MYSIASVLSKPLAMDIALILKDFNCLKRYTLTAISITNPTMSIQIKGKGVQPVSVSKHHRIPSYNPLVYHRSTVSGKDLASVLRRKVTNVNGIKMLSKRVSFMPNNDLFRTDSNDIDQCQFKSNRNGVFCHAYLTLLNHHCTTMR